MGRHDDGPVLVRHAPCRNVTRNRVAVRDVLRCVLSEGMCVRLPARTLLAMVALLVSSCADTRGDGPAAPDQEAPPVSSDGVRYELLATTQEAPEMGSIHHADDREAFEELWDRFNFGGTAPEVDLGAWTVLFYLRAEDACPDLIADVALDDGMLDIAWEPPPGGCNQPLLQTAFAVALHRSTVPATFTATLDGFHSVYEPTALEVSVAPPGADAAPPPATTERTAPPPPSSELGRDALPDDGEVTVVLLEDGTPVWVINHGAGVVSALATDVLPARPDDEDAGGVVNLRSAVHWVPALRQFWGGAQYDEFGTNTGGAAARNLDWYEVAVDGDQVVVGERVGPVPHRTPLRATQQGSVEVVRAQDPATTPLLTVEDALGLEGEQVVAVDADVVVWGTDQAALCVAPEPPRIFEDWGGCPPDALRPAVLAEDTVPDGQFLAIQGPVRLRVRGGEVLEVVLLGGGHTAGTLS